MQVQAAAMPTATETTPFAELHAQLSQAVLACRADGVPKAVHTLRTTTRRLEALLRKALEDHPRTGSLHGPARKALRQLKKVRRLAGAVRDLDVHQKLATKLLDGLKPSDGDRQRLQHDQRQLHHYLERKRERAAEVLASALPRREVRLERSLERAAIALDALPSPSTDPLTTAQRWVKRSAGHLSDLNRENLHGFRKQTKLARYLSEMQPHSPTGRTFTRGLLAVQDAIGEWHDLDLLHQEAKAVCGKHAALSELLATSADEAFRHALAAASTIQMS